MKKQVFLLSILSILFFTKDLNASHLIGGQIRWECLSNGKYIFYMDIYRECTGTPFFYGNQSLQVLNSALPAIEMIPDSTLYNRLGSGNISPKSTNGCQLGCSNSFGQGSDLGATQMFSYKSKEVSLNGVPPSVGYVFYWTNCCRPSNVINLSNPASQSYGLRAIMYPYKGQNSSTCYDSSPQFMENSIPTAFNNHSYAFGNSAKDKDGDSLRYYFAQSLDESATGNTYTPSPVYYASGYSYTSPFMDSITHPAYTVYLNHNNGFISGGKIFGNSGVQFAYCLRVDAYREGVRIASVFKDAPMLIMDNGMDQEEVSINIDGVDTNNYFTTVQLGDSIGVPINVVDTNLYADTNNPGTFRARDLALQYYGEFFSKDFNDENNCSGNFSSCATIVPAPLYDSSIFTNYVSIDSASLQVDLNWNISCDFLIADSGQMINSRYANFLLKLTTDQCPPQVHYANIQLKVERYKPQILRAANVLYVDPADSYQWYFNDSLIPNSNKDSIVMQASGKYSVQVVKNGCASQLMSQIIYAVGMEDRRWLENIRVYPNPFNQKFTIELPANPSKKAELELRDISGRLINIQADIQDNRILIDTSEELPSGVYFLNIRIAENSINRKIIKI